MKRRAARWLHPLLCAFLLSAQLAAVDHAIWHASGRATEPASAVREGADSRAPSAPELAKLCVFDAAFGQVLGGAPSACHGLLIPAGDGERTLHRVHAFLAADPPAPHSRGPPSLL